MERSQIYRVRQTPGQSRCRSAGGGKRATQGSLILKTQPIQGGRMDLLHTNSLASTIDAVNEALFFGKHIPRVEARRIARWIAGRQGLPGSYANMFAPTPRDYAEGIQLFTGERISSGAATGHILGEEACRTLLLLRDSSGAVREALDRATRSMGQRLNESEARRRPGFF